MSSFEIHNLEGNQMYFKNIGLHFGISSNKLKKKIIFEKEVLQIVILLKIRNLRYSFDSQI